ncbi:TetR/AcrR family transcriptional regulator [Streptomyces sp. YIM 98790]|uniref:TetR/AcrR family transcriptional regulator n=1 Tax=Streptomyces sp. YIM 98790 TaxID=2689077 RepID=UPI00140732D7|nr:TetR/AcrR family transcriptional regulator [Streptomyces sp. YIM 98790]
MGRSSTADQRLLDAVCELLRDRGYHSIGIAEICARADVRKGSFYHFFKSKEELVLAAVDQHWAREREMWRAALRPDAAVPERLGRLLDAFTEEQRAAKRACGTVSGCLLGNLAMELGSREPAVRARLADIFAEQVSLLAAALAGEEAAGDEGVREMAQAVIAQLEGTVLFARLANDPEVLTGLRPQVMRLLAPRP